MMSIPIELTVSQVRREIYLASAGQSASQIHGRGNEKLDAVNVPSDAPDYLAGAGKASRAELGTQFHRVVASLLSSRDADLSTIFGGASVDDCVCEMLNVLYRRELGPFLTRQAAALHGDGTAVLDLWTAVGEAARWFCDLFSDYRAHQIRNQQHVNPRQFTRWFASEVPLRMQLHDDTWTAPVTILGVADTIISLPDGRRCVVEYKLGRTSPAADLCQATLYHWMLGNLPKVANGSQSRGNPSKSNADVLALIRFLPQRSEIVLKTIQLHETQTLLKALIGKLAGVVPSEHDQGRHVVSPANSPLSKRPQSSSQPATLRQVQQADADATEVFELGKRLRAALREAGCDCSLIGEPAIGPTFVRFHVNPARGVSPRKFPGAADTIQVRLELQRPPVIQLGPSITIDLQRPDRQFVSLDNISLPPSDPLHGCSDVLIGVGVDGELRTAKLADTASYHLLVAGSSGSGKSEWLRTAVAGLIATNTTEQLEIVAIDPKRNAFHDLHGSPYLRQPLVFPDEPHSDINEVLDELIEEMERRYAMFDGCSSLAELIDRRGTPIPRIVCVCDEYGDLMLGSTTQRKGIEQRIARLGAKARASGIHLILATQQPSRKTITGAIQTNLPGRVGLMMSSATESRMMFDQNGAENLLGKGDLLYKDIGDPKRYQAVYLNDEQRRHIFSGLPRNRRTMHDGGEAKNAKNAPAISR